MRRYGRFRASVTVDGEDLPSVGIRKRTWCGSRSAEKPALRVCFDEYVPDVRWSGVKSLTLNNAVQDPAYVRQCLGYEVFARAGLPASRCSFAQVTVNGRDLGIYVNVEEVNRPDLARSFDDEAEALRAPAPAPVASSTSWLLPGMLGG